MKIVSRFTENFKVPLSCLRLFYPAPTDGKEHPECHFHMHFYPPLLRSATVKKFRVGYEMLGTPQRDITPEYSAKVLRDLSTAHYKLQEK